MRACNQSPSSPLHLQSPFISIPNLLSGCLSLDRRQCPRVSSAAIPQRSRTRLIVMELGDPGGSRWSGTCSTARLPVRRKSPHLHCWRPCLPRLSLLCRWPRRHVILGFHTRGGSYAFATCDTHGSRLPGVLCLSTSCRSLVKSASGQSSESQVVYFLSGVVSTLQAATSVSVYRRISMLSFVWFDFALFKNLF